jgi:UDP-N-acetylmuramoyl-L-alanyl-D-glutamate--2,6-diaminopimelate ligase
MPVSMRLSVLLENIPLHRTGADQDREITGLSCDSRQVIPGSLFFALQGEKMDGHRFIPQALAAGAVAVVTEKRVDLPAGISGFLAENGREAMALAASEFYRDPTAGMTVVGVTGTNGKTTVTYLIEAILRAAGKRPAVLGTINYRFGDRHLPASHTTPDAIDLLRIIREFRDEGADALVMEVSSHALDQYRVDGIRFSAGLFTNLTPEHLDYHGDMERYFSSKRRFFSLLARNGGRPVINVDDQYGARLAEEFGGWTCGTADGAQVRPVETALSVDGITAEVETPAGRLQLRSGLIGSFNLQNLLGAAAVGLALGLAPPAVMAGLAEAPQVPGRLERIENGRGALILVDYAHTGDALEKVLATLRGLAHRRIVTVFGCGGDRDRTKRPVMGEIAGRYSDVAVLTSDNPRTENPLAIMDEVRAGLLRVFPLEWSPDQINATAAGGFVTIADRREAIDFAVRHLGPGDLLLVAGKGHEDYQIIGCERTHFDDREELRRALTRLEISP